MNRRDFSEICAKSCLCAGACGSLTAAPGRAEARRPKYVLFLMTDQHRPQAMGLNGDPHALTPALDRLAASGMVFDNAYCQNPLCVPSRTSMMLGRYAHSTGVWGNTKKVSAPRDVKSYTQVMRENGRQTACFGKLHIHNRNDLDWDTARTWFKDFSIWAHAREPASLEKYRIGEGKPTVGQPSPYSKEAHEEWRVKEATIRYMKENVGKPWFIQCSLLRPHGPLMPPKEYWDRFSREDFALPSYPADDLDDCHPYLSRKDNSEGGPVSDPEAVLNKIVAYYACLAFVDDMFREVLEELDRLGIREETLIIYTADHGELLGNHHLWGKMNFFEEAVKIPLIFSMPGLVEPGQRSDALVELVDLFPTLMDVLGLETPDTAQGESLLPLLTGKRTRHRRVARSETQYWGWGRAAMQFDGRYKIIYEPKLDSCDLYDLKNDPRELTNLAGQPEHQERLAEAAQSLKAWSQQDARKSVWKKK